jgi:hypothetical protein
MDDTSNVEAHPETVLDSRRNQAMVHFQFGQSFMRLELRMTPMGLLAVGALVSSILLSVTPIIDAATRHLGRRTNR